MRSLVSGVAPPPTGRRETWLVIETREAFRFIEASKARPSIVIARFADLGDDLLRRISPDMIICPLVMSHFDAIEALQKIRHSTWQGRISIISPVPLPNHKMVERELKATAGGLKMELLIV